MANYTQYIPQLNSTTYPISITNCFNALTTDVTALETGKLSLVSGTIQTVQSEVIIKDDNLSINNDGILFNWTRPTGGVNAEAKIQVYDYLTLDSEFGWNFTNSNWFFNDSIEIISGNLTLLSGNITINGDTVATIDAALSNGIIVSADSSGRATTTSGIVAANLVERSGALTSGEVAIATTNNDIQTTGLAVADIATLSGVQSFTGNKTFSGTANFNSTTTLSGTNTVSGSTTFTIIPAFDGGASGSSAPFTVDSNFLVSNLNAELLNGQPNTYYAPLASPTFTGTPSLPTGTTAVTQSASDNSTKLATTAYADAAYQAFRGALAYSSSNQSINDNVATAVQFGAEQYDTDTIHDNVTSNTRLTVPTGVTKVRLTGQVQFANNTTGRRWVYITRNTSPTFPGQGLLEIPAALGTSVTYVPVISSVLTVSGGNYFTLIALQESGGALNVEPGSSGSGTWFAMEIIE